MTSRSHARATARAVPTLLRVGMAEALAYRAEFVIWMLTSTLPLVMLGLWTSVADAAPFASYSSRDFIAYYLATLIVRNLTGNWVVWHISEEIRTGSLSMRLLRPIHPFVTYAATHLASVPLRGLVALPFAAILLASQAGDLITRDPALLAMFAVSVVLAWALSFFMLAIVGSLAFYIEKSLAVFEIYLGVFAVLSGYLIPLTLLPDWAQTVAAWCPFRYMLSFPVELLLGGHDLGSAVRHLGSQAIYLVVVAAIAVLVWKRGLRRYEAFGA